MRPYTIAVIGKGVIGSSMAVLFTGNGFRTIVLAKEPEVGLQRVRDYYSDLAGRGCLSETQAEQCVSLLSYTQDYADLADAQFVFECIYEDLDAKREVYRRIEEACPRLIAIGSACSSLDPADLAAQMKQREKLIVTHPFVPPHLVPCVEIVKNDYTSPEALAAVTELLEYCGKELVTVRKCAPGYITNRLQYALFREAIYLVENGIASPEDVDKAIRTSWGPRYTSIGIFEHFDYGGLPLYAGIADYIYPTLSNASSTPKLIRDLIERGDLGRPTGRGVYDWTHRDMDAYRKRMCEPYYRFLTLHLPED